MGPSGAISQVQAIFSTRRVAVLPCVVFVVGLSNGVPIACLPDRERILKALFADADKSTKLIFAVMSHGQQAWRPIRIANSR